MIKKCLISVITWLSQIIMTIQTNQSLEKWETKLEVLLLKNSLDWSLKFLVDSNEHEKAKGGNKNVVAKKS